MKSLPANRHRKCHMGLLALLVLFIAGPATAQGPAKMPKSTVTIDGASEPERIPDWILWREIFRVSAELAEQLPTRGQDFWMERLHFSSAQTDALISLGTAFIKEEAQIDSDAKKLIASSGRVAPAALQNQLRQIQTSKEKRILTIRDQLKANIGSDAFNRMQSFARINIAPTIKVGKLEPGR